MPNSRPTPLGPIRARSTPLNSPELRTQIIQGARQGIPLSVLWRAAGVSKDYFKDWRSALTTGCWSSGLPCTPESLAVIQEFTVALDQALAECEARMVQSVNSAAQTANLKTGLPEWRAAAWYLEHSTTRERWFRHEEKTFHHVPALSPEARFVANLPDQDLLALTDPLWLDILGPSGTNPAPAPLLNC